MRVNSEFSALFAAHQGENPAKATDRNAWNEAFAASQANEIARQQKALPLDNSHSMAWRQPAGVIETTEEKPAKKSATQEFLEFSQKSIAEKYREMFLKELGLTEEELAALPKEKRDQIEDIIREKIEAKIKEDVEKKTGIPV